FPRIVFLYLTERGGEIGTRSKARMAPRNMVRGAKTQAIARPAACRPTSPACRNPAKTRGGYRFSLRAVFPGLNRGASGPGSGDPLRLGAGSDLRLRTRSSGG